MIVQHRSSKINGWNSHVDASDVHQNSSSDSWLPIHFAGASAIKWLIIVIMEASLTRDDTMNGSRSEDEASY